MAAHAPPSMDPGILVKVSPSADSEPALGAASSARGSQAPGAACPKADRRTRMLRRGAARRPHKDSGRKH